MLYRLDYRVGDQVSFINPQLDAGAKTSVQASLAESLLHIQSGTPWQLILPEEPLHSQTRLTPPWCIEIVEEDLFGNRQVY